MAPISYLNRAKIISLIEMDVSEARVATQLGIPKSSVNFIVRRWRESGLLERKAGLGHPRTSTEEEDQTLVRVIENRSFLSAVDALGLTNFPASVHTARRRIRAANLRNHTLPESSD
jgi:transposase